MFTPPPGSAFEQVHSAEWLTRVMEMIPDAEYAWLRSVSAEIGRPVSVALHAGTRIPMFSIRPPIRPQPQSGHVWSTRPILGEWRH